MPLRAAFNGKPTCPNSLAAGKHGRALAGLGKQGRALRGQPEQEAEIFCWPAVASGAGPCLSVRGMGPVLAGWGKG